MGSTPFSQEEDVELGREDGVRQAGDRQLCRETQPELPDRGRGWRKMVQGSRRNKSDGLKVRESTKGQQS